MDGHERAHAPAAAEPAPQQPAPAQPLTGPELVRSLSRSTGNRAVSVLLQRHGAHVAAPAQAGKTTTWDAVEADLSFSALGWEATGILKDNRISLKLTTSGPVTGYGARMIRYMFKRQSRGLSADLQPNQFETYAE